MSRQHYLTLQPLPFITSKFEPIVSSDLMSIYKESKKKKDDGLKWHIVHTESF